MARPVVDLPHPDSPTRPSVSLFSTKKSIPSTARTAPTWRWKMIPCVSGKCILSALTSRRFLPLSKVAVLRTRTMSGSPGFVGVFTAISAPLTSRPPRVGHLRVGEELRRVRLFDDLAAVHDVDPLRHARDDAEVVRDEDERGAELPREVLQEIQDLRLDRDVERGRRLVGEDELRVAR